MEITVKIDNIEVTKTVLRETMVDLLRLHGVDGVKACVDIVVHEAAHKYNEEWD